MIRKIYFILVVEIEKNRKKYSFHYKIIEIKKIRLIKLYLL